MFLDVVDALQVLITMLEFCDFCQLVAMFSTNFSTFPTFTTCSQPISSLIMIFQLVQLNPSFHISGPLVMNELREYQLVDLFLICGPLTTSVHPS